MSKRYPGGIIRKTPQNPTQTSAQGVWDMASVTQAVKENTWPIAGVPDPISRSLRFRSSASAYLNRTPASAGNRQIWTWSGWVKRGDLDSTIARTIFAAGTNGSSALDSIEFKAEQLRVYSYNASYVFQYITTQVFRDPSSWYHIVVAIDTTQATASNRVKIYVNGSQITAFGTATDPSLNANCAFFNTTNPHYFCKYVDQSFYTDCYLTEINFIDGQALTPSSFGSTNDQTGVWQPIAYTGTYGTNGFYLPFSDTTSTSTLGTDFSGNSNNWTTNNISLTSGSTYDSMVDVPTQWIPYNTAGDTGALWRGNYAVMNPLLGYSNKITPQDGNLYAFLAAGSNAYFGSRSTFGLSSGKWYWEVTAGAKDAGAGQWFGVGVVVDSVNWPAGNGLGANSGGYEYLNDGVKWGNGSSSAYGASWTTNDIIGVALDVDSQTITFYKNGTSQGTAFTSIGTGVWFPTIEIYRSTGTNQGMYANFGQRPFSYTPPAGFRTLCTTNLPVPTIGATPSTQANKYFDATLYNGTGSSLTVTNAGGFQPDLLWQKPRSVANNNWLTDSVRGNTKILTSNDPAGEFTTTDSITSINSNGFTLGTNSSFNGSGTTNVMWQWRANGTGVTNTAGSITSTVSANTTAGFSVGIWTGTGATGTIGHGLGVAPSMIIVKSRSAADAWYVYHVSRGPTRRIQLNETSAETSGTSVWNSTAPTSTVFSIGSGNPNTNSVTYVFYAFAEVAGYSRFGSYTGNGSSDGPFVFCGFRPRYLLIKRTDSTSDWLIQDTARSPYNVQFADLYPNLSNAENTSSATSIDTLSNGFKLRGTVYNASGGTYIYAAFAESPFKYALAR